jgi:hypothetical protein
MSKSNRELITELDNHFARLRRFRRPAVAGPIGWFSLERGQRRQKADEK